MDSTTDKPDGSLRREFSTRMAFIPHEYQMLDGHFRFRTSDKTRYTRDKDTGAIRRTDPKPAGKNQRRSSASCPR